MGITKRVHKTWVCGAQDTACHSNFFLIPYLYIFQLALAGSERYLCHKKVTFLTSNCLMRLHVLSTKMYRESYTSGHFI